MELRSSFEEVPEMGRPLLLSPRSHYEAILAGLYPRAIMLLSCLGGFIAKQSADFLQRNSGLQPFDYRRVPQLMGLAFSEARQAKQCAEVCYQFVTALCAFLVPIDQNKYWGCHSLRPGAPLRLLEE